MDFIHKRTIELSDMECQNLCDLFEAVFGKKKSKLAFQKQFFDTPLAYSFHGLMIEEGEIVGAYTAVPYRYSFFGEEMIFALAVDTMIHPKHRGGPFNVKKMAGKVYSALKEEGIPFVFGFPNDNIFEYRLKVLKWHHIGNLDYFVLPLRVGVMRPSLKWLNYLSKVGVACFMRLPRLRKSLNAARYIVKIDGDDFKRHRYGDLYEEITLPSGGTCIIRNYVEDDGVHVTYLIDVKPFTPYFFNMAVREVYNHVKHKSDIIIYVGKLDFLPKGLIRVPKGKEPKAVKFCGKILLPDKVNSQIYDISNWQIDLSNFDVR